jgi:(p)ppGpp synthase/HD superfamily hydrolase
MKIHPTEIKAALFATHAHSGQVYGGEPGFDTRAEPYINHPKRVAARLRELWAPEVVLVAAWLHDTVEDTPATLEDIEREFGPRVRGIVDAVSRRDPESYPAYIERVSQDPLATMVKRQDLRENSSRLPPDHSLQKRYAKALKRLTRADSPGGDDFAFFKELVG